MSVSQTYLSTICSFWMGASQIPVPIYQYRLVFPFDDKMINVATDMDFNVEGELKTPITKNIVAKSNFLVRSDNEFPFSRFTPILPIIAFSNATSIPLSQLGDRKSLTAELEIVDESSATQLQYSTEGGNSFGMSYMQAVTPSISIGGIDYLYCAVQLFSGVHYPHIALNIIHHTAAPSAINRTTLHLAPIHSS